MPCLYLGLTLSKKIKTLIKSKNLHPLLSLALKGRYILATGATRWGC